MVNLVQMQHIQPLYARSLTNTRFLQQQLFYPLLLWYALGLAVVMSASFLVMAYLSHSHVTFATFERQHVFLFIAVAFAYLLAAILVEKTNRFPGWSSIAVVVPVVSGVFLILVCLLLIGRLYYARSFLVMAYFVTLFWLMFGLYVRRRLFVPHLALVTVGEAAALSDIRSIRWQVLKEPILTDRNIHGVVVDLHADLPVEWQRFIANCVLHRIPVYHSLLIYESMTGRVSLDHLSEGLLNNQGPSAPHALIKRCFDLIIVLASLPIVVPFMLVMALIIRLDSPGPVLFIQKRVGREDRVFSMVKFRSMHVGAEDDGARFADAGDSRITRVGKFMRKLRVDELPQIWNILMGHMSLVGPRPEQSCFVKKFEEEIPFYRFRHSVRPGITGWAQVTHGYTADTESTTEKLERDIYYIKYMSFWLDFSILMRTARTLVTGFGAR
ncbi:MAG: exopolysaccharide biosynthesis polyprenyl glycosylphosphotransferase [Gammaproteobacteria bacterium]